MEQQLADAEIGRDCWVGTNSRNAPALRPDRSQRGRGPASDGEISRRHPQRQKKLRRRGPQGRDARDIESNESLQTYDVAAPLDGVVIHATPTKASSPAKRCSRSRTCPRLG